MSNIIMYTLVMCNIIVLLMVISPINNTIIIITINSYNTFCTHFNVNLVSTLVSILTPFRANFNVNLTSIYTHFNVNFNTTFTPFLRYFLHKFYEKKVPFLTIITAPFVMRKLLILTPFDIRNFLNLIVVI